MVIRTIEIVKQVLCFRAVIETMSQIVRSRLVSALASARASAHSQSTAVLPKRSFSSAAGHDDVYEMAKWKKITFLGIFTCSLLSIYHLSHGHEHFEEPPAYPYLNINTKDFPWGPYGLFTRPKKHD